MPSKIIKLVFKPQPVGQTLPVTLVLLFVATYESSILLQVDLKNFYK
jgi:hypothetical protein